MRLLELVPCCRKAELLVDSDGFGRHFPEPDTAHKVSSLCPCLQVHNDSQGAVPIHEEHEGGKSYSLTPVHLDSDGEFPSQNRRRTSRRNSRRNGRNSLSNSPEYRRLLSSTSTKQWKPSLDVISEDRVVSVAGNEARAARSAKKAAGKSGSGAKHWSYSVKDDLRQGPVQISIPVFSPTVFLF